MKDWNDSKDAEACAEPCLRPTIRFTAVKSEQQPSMQSVHQYRSRLAADSTQLVNPGARRQESTRLVDQPSKAKAM